MIRDDGIIGRGEKVSQRCGIRFPDVSSASDSQTNMMHALSTTLYSSHTDIDTKHNESNMPHLASLTNCFPLLIPQCLLRVSKYPQCHEYPRCFVKYEVRTLTGDKPVRTVQSVQSLASAVLQATSLQEQCKACNLSPQLL